MLTPSVTLLRTQSDERLVALARAGQERAFEAIVERYRKPLLRHCRRVLPEARAEDALQQAFVSAWTALQHGADVHDLRPWLHRIVRNTSLNALRVNGYDYDELRETLEGVGGPAELAERRALVRHTFAGLANLPERQREALLAIAVEGRSQEEVAEELGLTSGAVRQLVHRARTTLRAAATAVTPWPLVHWIAAAERGSEPLSSRLAEFVAGGATVGVSTTLAKAGAVAVIAGSAVSAPIVVDELRDGGAGSRAAAAATRTADGASGGGQTGTRPAALVAGASSSGSDDRSGRSGSGDDGGKGRGRGRGRGGDDGSAGGGKGRGRGRGRGGDDSSPSGSGVSGSSVQSSGGGDDDSSGGKGRGRGRGRGGDDSSSSTSGSSGSSSSGDDDGGKGRGRGRGRGRDDDDESSGVSSGSTSGSSSSGGDDDSFDDDSSGSSSSGSDDAHDDSDDDSGGASHDDDPVAEASAVVPEADSSGSGSGGDEDDD